jgi:hypothetical protein
LRGTGGGDAEEEESRHKRAKNEAVSTKASGLLGMLPKAVGAGGSARRRQGQKPKRSAAEVQAAYDAQLTGPGGVLLRPTAAAAVSRSPHGDLVPAASLAPSVTAATARAPSSQQRQQLLQKEEQQPAPVSRRLPPPMFSMPTGINAAPDVASSISVGGGANRGGGGTIQQQQHHPAEWSQPTPVLQQQQQAQPAFDEAVLAGMSKHERAQLQAHMGNLVDVNPSMMRQGAETYTTPGGEGFVSQFAGYASKPTGRSKSKHQITSLVYDLAQKEGDLLEKQGKNFQTKRQT